MLDTTFEQAGAQHQQDQSPQAKQESLATKHSAQLDTILPPTGTFNLTDLDGTVHALKLQTFPTFKTAQVLQMLAKVKDDIDIVSLIGEIQVLAQPNRSENEEQANEAQAERVIAAFNAIPKLIEVAPNLLLDFASLAVIPNKELRKAYEDDTLDTLREQKRNWLQFEFDASAPILVFSAYLPYLGVNFLRKALSDLNLSVTQTLTSL